MSKNTRIALIVAVAVLILAGLFVVGLILSPREAPPPSPLTAPSVEANGLPVFVIQPDESEARFAIDEVLRTGAFTVVGTTDQVAGEIAADYEQPQLTQLGVIRINVRTLRTDNNLRNFALWSQILNSDQPEFEFAEFAPQEVIGLPTEVTVGEAFEFSINGDLTVRGVTQPVEFEVSVTPEAANRLSGSARAVVRYEDFGIRIPDVPQVVSADENVRLELDFVATR
ncbi:MAG: YceI family protein [Chloroflexi bacterium]|nr:YceI family protein [Chloroflexota bacterium]